MYGQSQQSLENNVEYLFENRKVVHKISTT